MDVTRERKGYGLAGGLLLFCYGVSRPAYVFFWPVEDNRKKFRITLTNWVKILDLVAFASIKFLYRATRC